MHGFKFLALAAALAAGVVAHETCVPAVTVTVTVTECGTPDMPVPTPPVSSYEVVTAIPPPATSVESTVTAPLSPPPDTATPTSAAPPAPPADSGVPPVAPVPSSGQPVAPPALSSGTPVEPGPSSSMSAPGTTTHVSSTAAMTRPSPSTSTPITVSTAGAVLATPYIGLGSLFAAGAVLNAAMAVV